MALGFSNLFADMDARTVYETGVFGTKSRVFGNAVRRKDIFCRCALYLKIRMVRMIKTAGDDCGGMFALFREYT